MHPRTRLCGLLASLLLLLPASATAAPPHPFAEQPLEKLTIYAASGAPDSCGPGCDRWIAIEGRVDRGSAARVERFFRERKDTQRPIYFNSPGGEMRDGLAIGRLLRARKAVGRVGRTVVEACPGTQTDQACSLIKDNREEVRASLSTREAVCGSACTFLLFGASTREVAPDAIVAVHGALIDMQFRLNVTGAKREEAMAKAHAEAVRMGYSFVEEMGVSRDVMTLADSISPDRLRVLTRQELYDFRIDPRPFAETAWALQKTPHAAVQKIAEVRTNGSFQRFEWRLVCGGRTETRLLVGTQRASGSPGLKSITMAAGAAKPVRFLKHPISIGVYEIWAATLSADATKELVAAPRLAITEEVPPTDGKALTTAFDIDTLGLGLAAAELLGACKPVEAIGVPPKWPSSPWPPSPSSSSPWPPAGTARASPQWPAPPPVISQGKGVIGRGAPPQSAASDPGGR